MKEWRSRRHETYYIEGGNISMLFILLILRFTALRLSLLGPDPPPTWTHITSVPKLLSIKSIDIARDSSRGPPSSSGNRGLYRRSPVFNTSGTVVSSMFEEERDGSMLFIPSPLVWKLLLL